jgi:hypothetical protein
MKAFLVDVLMTSSGLGANSNYFVAPGEEPYPTSGSFNLGALDDRLVVGFLRGIVPIIKINPLGPTYRETLDKTIYMK